MIELNLAVASGGTKSIAVSPEVFGREFNEPLVHQVVVAQMNSHRQGTKAQLNRADVNGTTRKPWKQKGTGRARAGTTKSPLWRSGGIIFAARPRSFDQKVNKKMYRGAISSILSELLRQGRLHVVNDFAVEQPKTKSLVEKLKTMNLESALIVTDVVDENLYLAARNLPGVSVVEARGIEAHILIKYHHVVMTVGAIRLFEEVLK